MILIPANKIDKDFLNSLQTGSLLDVVDPEKAKSDTAPRPLVLCLRRSDAYKVIRELIEQIDESEDNHLEMIWDEDPEVRREAMMGTQDNLIVLAVYTARPGEVEMNGKIAFARLVRDIYEDD